MKITTTILREQRKQKPTGHEIGTIQNQCIHSECIDLADLLSVIASGGTFRPTECGKHKSDFVSGQLFALDFDNTDDQHQALPISKQITLEQAVTQAQQIGYRPFGAYHTFGHTAGHSKFRLLFVADRRITSRAEWEYCQEQIAGVFPRGITDHTNEPSRLFFGTDKGIAFTDFESTVSVDELLSGYKPKGKGTRRQARLEILNATNADSLILDAIRTHDADYIRKTLHRDEEIVFPNKDAFFRYLYNDINLADFLGVETCTAFPCVFPEYHTHGDTVKPSASVFKAYSGVWLYSCKAEGITLNIKQLTERLGGFKSEFKAIQFLKDCLNLRVEQTAWSMEQGENIDRILACLARTDEFGFATLCPTANGNLRYGKELYCRILQLAKDTILPDQVNDEGIVFYLPVTRLQQFKHKRDKVQGYLKMFIYHGLLEILPLERVPKHILCKQLRYSQPSHCLPNFYSVPSWVQPQLEQIEAQGQRWKQNGYRLKSISYECIARTEGLVVASKLYPNSSIKLNADNQLEQRKPEHDREHEMLTDIVIDAIQEKGYTTEKELVQRLARRTGKYKAERQVLRSISDIMTANNLVKVRCNKDLKQKYSIKGNGFPILIIQTQGF